MKVLFIGGTGTISLAITRKLATEGHDVYLINRGNRNHDLPENVSVITADINNEEDVKAKLEGMTFDSVCDFIAFKPDQVERDYRLFKGKTKQYIYISSASAYHKPVKNYLITEGTSLANPYWEYSRNKIACEDLLMKYYRENAFPVTIVRPSHTYGDRALPLGIHGKKGSWQNVKRMLDGKQVIVHGDGNSLWTTTHNTDFALGFCGLICNPHAIGEAFHITNDESLTWNQIYQTVADALGVEYKPYYVASEFLAAVSKDDQRGTLVGDKACTVVFDNSKLKRVVPEYRPSVHLEDGIRRTLNYILAHPELQVEDPEFDAWCDKVIEVLEKAKEELRSKL